MADYHAIARQAALKFGIPPEVFLQQIQQESGFNPHARSSAGAVGIAQFMPATARGFSLDPTDPVASLYTAARYDSQLLKKYGTIQRALSAYNSGRPDAYQSKGFAGGQTYNYVRSILGGQAPVAPLAPDPAPPDPGLFAQQRALLNAGNRMFGFGQLAPLPQIGPVRGTSSPTAAVPPIRPSGSVRFTGSGLAGVNPTFVQAVSAAAQAAGATKVRVISGYRSPAHNAAVGGVPRSNHITGNAMDGEGYVPGRGWVPLGTLLRSSASRFGLRSGDVAGFYHGGRDPNHVDTAANQR